MDNFDLKKYLAEGKLNENSSDGTQLEPMIPDFTDSDVQIMVYIETPGTTYTEPLYVFKGTGPELLNRCKGLFPDEWEENKDKFDEYLYEKFDEEGSLPLQFFILK